MCERNCMHKISFTCNIVAGHYDCGAIRAATKHQDLGLLENWLRAIRDVYRLHKEQLDLIPVSTAAPDICSVCNLCYYDLRVTSV